MKRVVEQRTEKLVTYLQTVRCDFSFFASSSKYFNEISADAHYLCVIFNPSQNVINTRKISSDVPATAAVALQHKIKYLTKAASLLPASNFVLCMLTESSLRN